MRTAIPQRIYNLLEMKTSTPIGRDGGLSARMALTVFLMGLLYVGFFAFMLTVLNVGIGIIIAIAAVMLFVQYFFSDKLALAAMKAKVVEPEDAPELHSMIDRLCMQADCPKPRVAIAQTSMPNAFATGRSPKHATVCVTTGILETLEKPELEGVLAHELSHVVHRDVAIMTIASFLAMVAGIMIRWGFIFGGGSRNSGGAAAIVVIFLVSILVYIISYILMQALSRYREFAADRGAAIITGRPSALISALTKISGKMEAVPTKDLREAQALNAFFILPASARKSIAQIFSTHPPLEKRIERLREMESQLQGVTVDA